MFAQLFACARSGCFPDVFPGSLLITGVHSCRPAWRINSCGRRHNRRRPHKSDTGYTRIQTRQLCTHAQGLRRRRCYGDAIRLHTNVPIKRKLGRFSFCKWVLATGGKGRFESFCDTCKLWFHCRYYSHPSLGSLVEKDGTIEPPLQSLTFKHSHTHTLVWSLVSEVAPDTLLPPPPPLPPIREGSSSSPLPVTWVISLCCFILAR